MKLSIVDLSVVQPGEGPSEALQHSLELAELADGLGYERIWFSEHHAKSLVGRAPVVRVAYNYLSQSRLQFLEPSPAEAGALLGGIPEIDRYQRGSCVPPATSRERSNRSPSNCTGWSGLLSWTNS